VGRLSCWGKRGQGDAEKRGERGCSDVIGTDGIPFPHRLSRRGRQETEPHTSILSVQARYVAILGGDEDGKQRAAGRDPEGGEV
jgi:hypothetical protein